MQVVAARCRFCSHNRPDMRARKWQPEEVEALPALPEIDHLRLVRMQLAAPASPRISPHRRQGVLGLAARRHNTTKSSA